ncbi:MAG: tetratricopeptide (TPR) repeat protein [Myxococcota bacterium]|jgi:tetratricopeptide (TPR) repeat protein
MRSVLGLVLALAGATAHAEPAEHSYSGETPASVDLLRVSKGGPRIYVQADLPGGHRGLFLVDTGADISVITEDAANRMGLDVIRGWGEVRGLSGSVSTDGAVVPWVELGGVRVPDIAVAVNVPGVSDSAYFMPQDGILGNNVWSRFVLEIDYPADLMVLHAPGTVKQPKRAAPMLYDGHHLYTPLTLTTAGDEQIRDTIVAQLDTGAGELLLCNATGARFEDATTEGLEPVRGIGASETLPPFRFLKMTRRIPLSEAAVGGRRLDLTASARWVGFEDQSIDSCPSGFRALMGHQYLADSRVILDYQEGWASLARSRRPPRLLNGHGVLYAQDVAAHADDPSRGLLRAQLLLGEEREEDAVAALEAFSESGGGTAEQAAEARVLLARLHRLRGRLDAAWEVLTPLSPGELVDQGQVVASVNGLAFEGRGPEALDLARAAVEARPDDGWSHVALADAQMHAGDSEAARDALYRAAQLEQYPDAHLVRRARVALAVGDRLGSMAHIRKLLQLYPHEGQFIWFYALLVENEAEASTFRADLEAAMARLHPFMQPYDFLVAAYRVLGDDTVAQRWMDHGIEEHCSPMSASALLDNCMAWYWSLAGQHPDASLVRIDRALAESGARPDFLDTKAMVHVARGEYDLAFDASLGAARLSPEDPYMLWQAERIGQLVPTSATADAP